MKNSGICSKCQSSDIIRVPGHIGGYGSGNNILLKEWLLRGVPVSRYLCGSCGFIEEWLDDREDIAKVRKKYSDKQGSRKG